MLHEILKKYWNYDSFRPLQEDIIKSVLAGVDTLAILPTGGGKSICFQVPTMAAEGLCIVITPLIALMKDQVEQLRRREIKAAAIFSGMHYNEIDLILDNCIHGDMKFLYVSPERIHTDIFQARVKQMKVSLLAIDEAHCISQWGYDFRPSYLRIAELRELLPKVPLIALTATATLGVSDDICEKLNFKNHKVFCSTFARENLSFSTFLEENKQNRLVKIINGVQGSAIVYVKSRKLTQDLAQWLNRNNVRADFYHGGLNNKVRSDKQDAWLHNRVRIMVCTNAFGMGIDKPDVRLVVHLDLPESLEAYYQEAGRGGRDGRRAYAVALYSRNDLLVLKESLAKKYPPLEAVKRVYQALSNYFKIPIGGGEFESFDFDFQAFIGTFGLQSSETHYCLKMLQSEGFIHLSETFFSPSKIHITATQKELYDLQLRNPQIDGFIKLVLRMYGGELFTHFVNISETAIAQKFYILESEVVQMLQNLHQKKVLDYEKQRDKPQLMFLTPRFDANLLPINALKVEEKKEIEQKRLLAVKNYAENPARCRMTMLQRYFGEIAEQPCGICDNCLDKKKRSSTADYQTLENHVVNTLKLGVFTPQQLVASVGLKNETLAVEIIKDLLADEKIGYDSEGRLSLKN